MLAALPGIPRRLPRALASAPNSWYSVYITGIHADLPRQILDVRPLQARARVSRVFHRHPRMLQKQALLRVYSLRVNRRYVEKQRIEFIDPGNEATPLAVMVSALTAILAKVLLPVPALPGHFNDAILPLAQIVPIGVDIARLGIATAQSDNRDRIGFRCRA